MPQTRAVHVVGGQWLLVRAWAAALCFSSIIPIRSWMFARYMSYTTLHPFLLPPFLLPPSLPPSLSLSLPSQRAAAPHTTLVSSPTQ